MKEEIGSEYLGPKLRKAATIKHCFELTLICNSTFDSRYRRDQKEKIIRPLPPVNSEKTRILEELVLFIVLTCHLIIGATLCFLQWGKAKTFLIQNKSEDFFCGDQVFQNDSLSFSVPI